MLIESNSMFKNHIKSVYQKRNAEASRNEAHDIPLLTKLSHVRGLLIYSSQLQAQLDFLNSLNVKELSPKLHNQAVPFFFANYVTQSRSHSGGRYRGNHEYLPDLYDSDSPGGPISTTIMALGLASLSNKGRQPELMFDARRKYVQAIKLINRALDDPSQMKSDHTVAAVMLLGLFEAVTCTDKTSMKAMSHHILGAAQLINLRGPEQFRGEAALRIYFQLRRLIVLICVQIQEPLPLNFHSWMAWAQDVQSEDEKHANRFSEIHKDLSILRSSFKSCTITDPTFKIDSLLAIDRRFEEWEMHIPLAWKYTSFVLPENPETPIHEFEVRYDIYADTWVGSMWNNYRSSRILIHDTLLTLSNSNPDIGSGVFGRNAQLRDSQGVLVMMTRGICHSVPFFLGVVSSPGTPKSQEQSNKTATPGGYLLLWPLYMSGMIRTTTPEQRSWIANQLEIIGNNLGAQQAIVQATSLRKDMNKTFSSDELWSFATKVEIAIDFKGIKKDLRRQGAAK